MNTIITILGALLGYVIYIAYQLTNSYGFAILLFAVFANIIKFPVSILTHRNSIRLLQIQPKLNNIKRYYSCDKDRLYEERYNLFKEEKYSPFFGLIPLFIRLIFVIGIMQVMYHPFQHILRFEPDVINAMVSANREITGVYGGTGEQLRIIKTLQYHGNLSVFHSALVNFPNATYLIQTAANIDLSFLWLDLGETPSIVRPTIALVVPLFAVIVALAFCLAQSRVSPGALSQGKKTNWSFTISTVGLSLYFALATPVGVGLYWVAGNLLGIASIFVLNHLYNPKKLARDTIAQIEATRKTPDQLRKEREINKELRAREKHDVIRFKTTKKHLVFYAISGGQYKYYKNIIEYILENSDAVIHYLTNDSNDALFKQHHERLIPYYTSQRKTISLMLKLDCAIFATTVIDLHNYHMKRSVIRDDIEYIYIPHGLSGGGMVARENALDHYDTIFCTGSKFVETVRKREELARLPRKKLVKSGSGILDQLIESYKQMPNKTDTRTQILIAPSWQKNCILDLCINDMLDSVLGKNYRIIIRPHPQYTGMFPERIELLKECYVTQITTGELIFELDFSGNHSIFQSDFVITDWSNIALEFSYSTLKPSIFINTPMKVLNENYKLYGEAALIRLRDRIGVSIDVEKASDLNDVIIRLLSEWDSYKDKIAEIACQNVYHHGRNGEAGGRYIIDQLKMRGVLHQQEIAPSWSEI